MNKNLFKSLALAAVAVIAGACAKESEQLAGPSSVTFEVSTPEIATKAIGDGMTATKLYYQVFDADGNAIEGLGVQNKDLVSGKTTVSFQLIKDQTYNFIFWAQTAETGYYIIDEAEGLKKITADYTTHKGANDENRDAFFAVEKGLKITGPVSKTVKLTRPFAQVNIGTNDELKAGTTTAPAINLTGVTSKVVIKGVPTVFAPLATTPETMLTGATDVTFISAAVPAEKLVVKGVEYNYLAMNYVFAPAEGTVCDLTAEFALVDRAPIPLSSPATPIKRNYRTNILGKLLTSSADFNIEVDPGFEGGEDIYPIVVNGVAYKTLDAAVAAARAGEQTIISLNNDMAGNGVKTINGQDVVIDLGGHTFDIDGSLVGSTGTETNGFQLLKGSKVTFKNGTLKSKKALLLIQNYSDLTLENVTLDATGGAAHYVLSNNHGTVKIIGSTSILAPEGKHAFDVYYYSPYYSDGVNVYVNTTGTIRGAIEYACAEDEDACNKKTSLVIDNAVLENSKFETKLLTPNMKIARRVFADEAAATAWIPAGYKLMTDGDYYGISVTMVASQDELNNELAGISTEGKGVICLGEGEFSLCNNTSQSSIAQNKTLEFTGKGIDKTIYTIGDGKSVGGDGNCDYSIRESDVTFKNMTVKLYKPNENYQGFAYAKNIKFVDCKIDGRMSYLGVGDAIFENCTFVQTEEDYNLTTWSGKKIVFDNCIFNSPSGKFINVYRATGDFDVFVKNCTFTSDKMSKSALELKGDYDYKYNVWFEGLNSGNNLNVSASTGSKLYNSNKRREGNSNLIGQQETASTVYIDNKKVWEKGAKVE